VKLVGIVACIPVPMVGSSSGRYHLRYRYYWFIMLVRTPTSAGSEKDGVCRLAIVSHVLEGGVDLPKMPWWEVGRSTVLGANKEWYDLNPPFRTIEPKFHRTLSMLHMNTIC
jgi:hypothetical protein